MSSPTRKQLPPWVLPAVVVGGVLVLGLSVWKGVTGASAPTGPSTAVHAGMVDFHKEAAKGNVGSPRAEADEDDKAEKNGKPPASSATKGKATEPDGDNDGDGDREKAAHQSPGK